MTAPDYAERCPNAHRLLANLNFSAEDESRMMQPLLDHKDALESRASGSRTTPRTRPAGLKV